MLRFQVLGPLAIASHTGAPISVTARQQRALLAVLAGRVGGVVDRDELIDILWPSELPNDPRNTLQHYVARLRAVLGAGAVRTSGSGYLLTADPQEVDAVRFEELAGSAQNVVARDARGALRDLDAALGFWRGEPYTDLGDSLFALAERARLTELRAQAEDARYGALISVGDAAGVIPPLTAATAADPGRESLWVKLMLALYRCGRQAEALAAFQRARRHLADELGLEPGPALRDLETRVLHQDPDLLHRPGGQQPTPYRRSVRRPGTSFVGRAEALHQLTNLIGRARLVTVRGPVGVGKTRLVLEWAAAPAAPLPPITLVELEPVHHGALLASRIAAATDVAEDPASDATDRLVGQLRDRDAILVLDGCDSLLDHVRTLVDRLLGACPAVRIVCTASSPIGLPDEAQLVLGGLPAGADEAPGDGALLFLDRARDVRPYLRLVPSEVAIVRSIVDALDGTPFALELAAARTRTSSLEEILTGVIAGSDSLRDVATGRPDRQSSLRAALHWTVSQLPAVQRATLTELCELPGTFTKETATAIVSASGEDLETALDQLVAHALLKAQTTPTGTRFVTTPSTRHHLGGMAGDPRSPTTRRIVRHYAALAERVDRELRGHSQMSWLATADLEAENLRHTITVAADLRDATALETAARLGRYWDWRGLIAQANDAYTHVLDLEPNLDADPPSRAMARVWGAFFAWEGGDHDRASSLIDAAVAIASEDGTSWLLAAALGARGLIVSSRGPAADPAGELEVALDHAARHDDPWWSAWISTALARCRLQHGDDVSAARLARHALDTFRRVGDERAQGWAFVARAEILSQRRRYADARAAARDAARLACQADDPRTIAAALEVEARNLHATGRLELATEAAARLDAMQLARGAPLPPSKDPNSLDRLLDLEDRLGHERFAAAWARGRTVDVLDVLGRR